MKRVFADAWFYIALLDADDQGHERAAAWFRDFTGTIFTTRWVLAEVANSLAAPALRGAMAGFLRAIESAPEVCIVADSDRIYLRGVDLFAGRADKAWSLTDCISFVVMAEEGMTDALSADRHFAQAGFNPLLAAG